MKRLAIIAMLIAAVVAAACGWRTKSTTSENSGGKTQQASAVGTSPSTRSGYVTDSASVMDQTSRNDLESTLAALKQRKKIDFAVITVGSTGTKSASDVSLDLARERSSTVPDGRDNGGLLLLVAVNDRHWHIQVSRNLEDKLTNEILTTLSQPMADSFKQNRYSEGIIRYVNAIISKLAELDSSGKGKPAKPKT